MKILAVDTALGACSAAIMEDSRVLARRFEPMERGHAERLAPMVEEVMAESGLTFGVLDRLGVTTGPGTFTGQRVGLAFMRGMRVALKRPLLGVTSLAAMNLQALSETGLARCAAVHDARRNEVYFETGGENVAQDGPRILAIEDAAREIMTMVSPVVLAGTASARIADLCAAGTVKVVISKVQAPDAVWVARLCAKAIPTGAPPSPLYLREPDARPQGSIK
jgi:tRNA threonylcarbamoyladenosine biosynthesis protein TsaB